MNDKPMTTAPTERLNALQHEINEYAKVLRHTPFDDHARVRMVLEHMSELVDECMREKGISEAEIAEINARAEAEIQALIDAEMPSPRFPLSRMLVVLLRAKFARWRRRIRLFFLQRWPPQN